METVRFDELDLYPQVLRAIKEMGFEEATPIQSQAIPVVMSGVDVIGQAQTGTGKTASFGIPVLHKVDPNNKKTQVIILSPTRELAIQVSEEIRKLSKYMHGVKILPVYGGQDINRQIKALKGGAQIIIGTPGRVMDHLRRKTIRCEAVNTIVLDEADEMLKMGFVQDVEKIIESADPNRQLVMFSATTNQDVLTVSWKYQHDPIEIVVQAEAEVPLAMGITDELESRGIKVFGPNRKCSQLEASKSFTKAFLGRHDIPTAGYKEFTDKEELLDAAGIYGYPMVLKPMAWQPEKVW